MEENIEKKNEYPIVKCEYISADNITCESECNDSGRFCEVHRLNPETDIEFYKQIVEHFRQDIRQFFVRSNFYFVAQTALLYLVYNKGIPKSKTELILIVGGIIFGIILSVYWFLVSKGAVRWMHRWRMEVVRLDKMLNRFQSYSTIELNMRKSIKLSPSELTSHIPIIFLLFWFAILGYNVVNYSSDEVSKDTTELNIIESEKTTESVIENDSLNIE